MRLGEDRGKDVVMVEVAAERGKQLSSRVSEEGAGWACQRIGTFTGLRPDTQEFTWFSPRTLWHSRNQIVAGLLGDPSGKVRRRWVAQQEARGADPDFRVRPGVGQSFSFLLLGDTGEGDASQYAVGAGPAQGGRRTPPSPSSPVTCIYPAGSAQRVREQVLPPVPGLSTRRSTRSPATTTGTTGSAASCASSATRPPLASPTPRQLALGLRGLLWRKPDTIDERLLAEARELRARPAQQAVQPGPYWAIETPGLLIVGIDTGIHGGIDARTGRVAAPRSPGTRGPKILVTGKPIYTRNDTSRARSRAAARRRHRPRPRAPLRRRDRRRHPQLPALPGQGGRPGRSSTSSRAAAGAFMHATHTIPPGRRRRACTRTTSSCYPLRGDSLSFYSQLYASGCG